MTLTITLTLLTLTVTVRVTLTHTNPTRTLLTLIPDSLSDHRTLGLLNPRIIDTLPSQDNESQVQAWACCLLAEHVWRSCCTWAASVCTHQDRQLYELLDQESNDKTSRSTTLWLSSWTRNRTTKHQDRQIYELLDQESNDKTSRSTTLWAFGPGI